MNCGGTLGENGQKSGIIATPGYNRWGFKPNQKCVWKWQRQGKQSIIIKVLKANLGDNNDKVCWYDNAYAVARCKDEKKSDYHERTKYYCTGDDHLKSATFSCGDNKIGENGLEFTFDSQEYGNGQGLVFVYQIRDEKESQLNKCGDQKWMSYVDHDVAGNTGISFNQIDTKLPKRISCAYIAEIPCCSKDMVVKFGSQTKLAAKEVWRNGVAKPICTRNSDRVEIRDFRNNKLLATKCGNYAFEDSDYAFFRTNSHKVKISVFTDHAYRIEQLNFYFFAVDRDVPDSLAQLMNLPSDL